MYDKHIELAKEIYEELNKYGADFADGSLITIIAGVISNRLDARVMLQKGEIEQKYKDFRDYILEKEKEGKIVVNTEFGLGEISLDEIVKQHTEGLLYDLNRDRCTILTFIEDEKWVNDFACMKVIEKLKALLST
jgi:hypothetical protein